MTIPSPLTIAAVEREVGLSKDVLRKWESRYGFPAPTRDAQGERLYPAEQVDRLRLIKRLMDTGMRPARLVTLDMDTLVRQARERPGVETAGEPELDFSLLRAPRPDGLRRALRRALLSRGLESFVLDTLAPLNQRVGEAWAHGELGVHEEHVYTEVAQGLLRECVEQLEDGRATPRMLFTTLPGEQHGLGLLMAASLLALEGAHCLLLGTQTPLRDIATAARERDIQVVVLSFSAVYPRRLIVPALEELHRRLGGGREIWTGGAGTARLESPLSGLRFLRGLEELSGTLADWRNTPRESAQIAA